MIEAVCYASRPPDASPIIVIIICQLDLVVGLLGLPDPFLHHLQLLPLLLLLHRSLLLVRVVPQCRPLPSPNLLPSELCLPLLVLLHHVLLPQQLLLPHLLSISLLAIVCPSVKLPNNDRGWNLSVNSAMVTQNQVC